MSVHLVGAGPGDPGLLTLRAAELLGCAEVVLFDRLVDPRVLALAPAGAELVDVGKLPGSAASSPTQSEISSALVHHARLGRRVVRLKGGDPFLFGRGGEEALALEDAGEAYEVVPGVSAALSAAAAAGVPVTHRGLASAVTVLSGHDVEACAKVLEHAATCGATLVVLMGVATRAELASRLIGAGMPARTPVVVVERATTPSQRSQRLELGELGAARMDSPATIVIGAVAGLSLAGYEDRPLFGHKVVVTRAAHQAHAVAKLLAERGAGVLELPVIEIVPPSDGGAALAAAAKRIKSYAWVVLSSANAVAALFAHLRDARDLGDAKLAAIGSATVAALDAHGVVPDLVPRRFVGEALVEAFPVAPADATTSSARLGVLLARAGKARDVVPDGLARLGWKVEVVEAYRTVTARADPPAIDQVGSADVVAFTSPSTVTGFLALAGRARLPPVVASLGPITTAACRAAGIEVAIEAAEHSVEGLVASLVEHLGTGSFAPRRLDAGQRP